MKKQLAVKEKLKILFVNYSCLPPTCSNNSTKNNAQKNNTPIPTTTRTDLSINADAKKNENGSPNVTNTIMAKMINPKITFIRKTSILPRWAFRIVQMSNDKRRQFCIAYVLQYLQFGCRQTLVRPS